MRQLILSLLLLHLAACSGMQTVRVHDLQNQGEDSLLQPGDRVEVLTHNNEKLDFTVTDVAPDGLAGKFGFVPYEEIRRLRVHRPGHSDKKDLTWLWGILGAAALIGLISAADSVTACSNTPCPQPDPN